MLPNSDLIGKRYVNLADSGDLVLEVLGVDELYPKCVIVKPIGYERAWPYSAEIVRRLIQEQSTQSADAPDPANAAAKEGPIQGDE